MGGNILRQPSALATTFTKVPETADLVVKHLDPSDTEDLLLKTEPALVAFCWGSGGGIGRFLKLSQEGQRERKLLRKLPSLPRLLEKEWQEKLLGKRLVAEDTKSDDTVCFSLGSMKIVLLPYDHLVALKIQAMLATTSNNQS